MAISNFIAIAFLIVLTGKCVGYRIQHSDMSPVHIYSRRTETVAQILAMIVLISGTLYWQSDLKGTSALQGDRPSPSPLGTLTCVSGAIVIDGSSALYSLVNAVAKDYMAKCPQAEITVHESSSEMGLNDVETSKIAIANSDIAPMPTQADLIEHDVAVVVFVLVTNPSLNSVTTLSSDQLRGIYDGTVIDWNTVGGPDLPISLITRVTSSGTRSTFDHYILCNQEHSPKETTQEEQTTDLVAQKVSQTQGALGYVDLGTALRYNLHIVNIDGQPPIPDLVKQNTYKFWNIERMYTKGLPRADSLTSAFLQYMTNTPEEELIAESLSYIKFNTMYNSSLSNHKPCG
jgi:phosphate transport system substrate-binding protein